MVYHPEKTPYEPQGDPRDRLHQIIQDYNFEENSTNEIFQKGRPKSSIPVLPKKIADQINAESVLLKLEHNKILDIATHEQYMDNVSKKARSEFDRLYIRGTGYLNDFKEDEQIET